MVVTKNGVVILDASDAARILRNNGTMDEIKKHMSPMNRKPSTLPADFTRCFGVLDDHSADQTCPRRFACARFQDKDDIQSFQNVRWALCTSAHDHFVGKGDAG